jgi:hypothetical protein
MQVLFGFESKNAIIGHQFSYSLTAELFWAQIRAKLVLLTKAKMTFLSRPIFISFELRFHSFYLDKIGFF